MAKTPLHRQKCVWLIAIVCVVAAIAAFFFWPKMKPDDSLNVPLGVEQAAIVTYSGPHLAVTPYKWGVAVNARIARVTEQDGTRVYDVRYIANREGTYDLKDYLTGEDGNPLAGLPSFKFHGDAKLAKHLDARIQETEQITIDVGGHYYATLAALGVFWILWLLLIIFWRRPKKRPAQIHTAAEPTLAQLLRAFLTQLQAGTLDAASKARMEMILLRRWREEAAISGMPMSAALEKLSTDTKTGGTLRQLQDWLHRPKSTIKHEEIAAILAPYTTEPITLAESISPNPK